MATELSEQEFGRYECPIPEYPNVWVKFRNSGYPCGLRKRLDDARIDDVQILDIILPFVEGWGLVDITGKPVPLPPPDKRTSEVVVNVEEGVTAWLIGTFYRHRIALLQPRPNSSAPSSET